jgi:nitrite reductase/ring-hydroxylating ferredoxin subunit
MPWLPAGPVEQFPEGEIRIRHLLGRAFGVRREAGGGWRAIELACRHQGADLTAGRRDGSIVVCPRHGWRYDLATGACLTDPSLPLRSLEVRIESGKVWIRSPPLGEDRGEIAARQ